MKRMKRALALVLALSCLASCFAGCGSKKEDVETTQTETTAAKTTQALTTEAPSTEAPTTEAPATEEPSTEAPKGFTNPLTGEATETDISGNRPVAAMLNTLKKALPQSGNSQADVLIEVTEEGGITRVMALYQSLEGVGNIGTIRSTREYFSFLAMGFDAILLHCGGSSYGLNALSKHNYTTLNQMKYADLYWRDSWRQKNVGQEHSLYTSGEKISKYLASTTKIAAKHDSGYSNPWKFTENGTPDGDSAKTVKVKFSSYKNTWFTYDESSKKYSVSFFSGSKYVDDNNDAQVTVSNVIIIPTTQSTKKGTNRQQYDLSSGTGYYCNGGKYTKIKWKKGGDMDSLKFYDENGETLQMGVGKTYICIVSKKQELVFE